jgi:flagellar FliL protein
MSEGSAAPAKKGGKKKLMIIIGAISVLGGGGGAAGFYAAGSMKHAETGPAVDPNRPQLVLKGENPEEIAAKWTAEAKKSEGHGEAGEGHDAGKGVDLPGPKNTSAYQATYFQIPAPFTTNLADSDSFAQISVAVSTYYDNRVIQAVQSHELAIRSAILMMLAQEQQVDLSTPLGKEQLQGKMVKIINDTLKAKSGFGGIDNVYFTNFVIQ